MADLAFAVRYDVEVLEVVTSDRSYTIRRPVGEYHGDPSDVGRVFKDTVDGIMFVNPDQSEIQVHERALMEMTVRLYFFFAMEDVP
jgi:hypothetical protein